MAKEKKYLYIERIGSGIRQPKNQKAMLQALRVTRAGKKAKHLDTPQVRGAVAKIGHLVRIID